jgi:hypothetical protein
MPRLLALPSAATAALALTLTAATAAKPCSGEAGGPALEELLPRVRVALGLAGTEQVAIDPTRRCIGVQVRTTGTARLVKLLLRGLEVPREAVELRVVEAQPAPVASTDPPGP